MTVDVVSEAPDAAPALLLLLNVLGDVAEPPEQLDAPQASPVEARLLALAAVASPPRRSPRRSA
ncbi:hypothetical protein [Saccharopolyspora elongata]|uniref:hypothetical protein n=1 Tax=Saccharopolyspora elongata TaxID=2530387 RepID=UPI001A9D36B5|nr:hypothetical protein [Saccharopolyspora elongata]